MALAARPTNTWLNADGLLVKYGTQEGIPGKVGEYQDTHLGDAVVNVEIDYSLFTGITATQAVIVDYGCKLPAGAIIDAIRITTDKAFATNPTSIDVGLVREDMTSTYDEDGLIDGLLLATFDSVGETTELLSTTATYPGALWVAATSAPLPYTGYIVASFAGTAPTVGNLKLKIQYHVIPTRDNGNKLSDV